MSPTTVSTSSNVKVDSAASFVAEPHDDDEYDDDDVSDALGAGIRFTRCRCC